MVGARSITEDGLARSCYFRTTVNAPHRKALVQINEDGAADNSERESALYTRAVADLHDRGWPVQTIDCTTEAPEVIAARIVSLIHRTLSEKSLVCP